MRKNYIILFFLLLFNFLFSQEELSLIQALENVRKNNKSLQINVLDTKNAEADLQKTKSVFLPQVNISYTGISTNDPLNSFGFKLQQKVVEMADFNPETLNDPENILNFNTKFSIKQPLLNLDLFEMKKAVNAKIEASKWQGKRIEQAIELEVKKAYTDLQFLYEAEDVSKQGIKTYRENERVIKNMLTQGLVKKTDLLTVQIKVKDIENQLLTIQNNIENISDFLSYLMGENLGKVYKPTTNLEAIPTSISKTESGIYLGKRPDFEAMKKGVEAREFMMKAEKKKLFPRLNAFGEYNLNDKNPIGFGAGAYMVGMQMSWNVFDGNQSKYEIVKNKVEIEKAQAELSNEMAKSKLDISKTERELETMKLKISLAESNVNHAEESLKIISNRYKQGLEKAVDVMNSETILMEKKLQVLEVIKEYNKILYQLDFLTAN